MTGKGLDISIDGETPPTPAGRRVAARDRSRGRRGRARDRDACSTSDNTKILTPEGEAVSSEGAPTFGFGIDTAPALAQFNPLNVLEGTWPAAGDEVVIDAGTADEQGYEVGDTVEISTLQPKRAFELVGVAQYGSLDSLGERELRGLHDSGRAGAARPRGAVRRDLGRGEARASRRTSSSPPSQPALPTSAEVVSATAEAEEQVDEVSEFTQIFRYFLLAFAAIALFVGAFVIFNTFSITVAQRTREFATLRTIGASRRQVLGSVILESLVIGLARVARRPRPRCRCWPRGSRRCSGASESSFRRRTAFSRCARWSSRSSSASASRCSRGCSPRSARRACRRSLPCARARRSRRSRFARFTPWIAALVVVGCVRRPRPSDVHRRARDRRSAALDRRRRAPLFLGVAMLSSHLVTPIAASSVLPARTGGRRRRAGSRAATPCATRAGLPRPRPR